MSRFHVEINGRPANVSFGRECDADAHARKAFLLEGVRQVRVMDNDRRLNGSDHDEVPGPRCVLHLGAVKVRRNS